MAVVGAGFNTPMTVVVQKNIAPEKLGRALTVLGSFTSLASLIGLGAAGIFGDITGVPFVFVASGVGMLLVIGASLFAPSVHHLDDPSLGGEIAAPADNQTELQES
jgi:predicted MFS family arabinose efflux permease